MNYQVWINVEYEGWKKVDCEDLPAAQGEILKALMEGKEPLLTVEVPYDFTIKIKEDKIGEAKTSETKRDKGTRVKGESEVRPGAPESIPSVSKGSGDSSPDNSVPGK